MMERHDPFPTEACEEGNTLIFLILREGLEIEHDKKSKRQERERKRERQKWMCRCRLKRERDGRIHICQLDSQQKFTETTIDESEWRRGINEDDNEGEDEKEERGKRQVIGIEENVSDRGNGRERCHRNIKGIVAERDLIGTGFVFEERFVMRTIDFRQEIHRDLQKENHPKAEPERICSERLAEVIGKAGAEEIGQRGEEEVERAVEF